MLHLDLTVPSSGEILPSWVTVRWEQHTSDTDVVEGAWSIWSSKLSGHERPARFVTRCLP